MLPTGKLLGGAPANFAYHVNDLGISATVVSSVGNDASGDEIVERVWKHLGMDSSFIEVTPNYPTGTVGVTLNDNGAPSYEIFENVAWDHIQLSVRLKYLLSSLKAVCFGTLAQRSSQSRATILSVLDGTPGDCLRVFDINLRQQYFTRDIVVASLKRANVLKLNDEELPRVTEMLGIAGDDVFCLNRIREIYNLSLVALTRGANGSLLIRSGEQSEHPGIPTKVVDTIGAGDAFTAAMVVGLLKGDELESISEMANCRAAQVCSHSGAVP